MGREYTLTAIGTNRALPLGGFARNRYFQIKFGFIVAIQETTGKEIGLHFLNSQGSLNKIRFFLEEIP
jgi:hypothetical protein